MLIELMTAALGLSVAHAAVPLECKAIYRTVNESGLLVESKVKIPIIEQNAAFARYTVTHEGRYFSIVDDGGKTYLVQIVRPPDFTQGIVLRAAPDSNGVLNVAEVNGYDVHKIECRRPLN